MDNQHNQSNPKRGHTLLEGLNLVGVIEQLKIPKSFYEANQPNEPAVSPDNRYLEVDSKPGNRNFQTMFGGLHVVEAFKIFNTQIGSSPVKKSTEDNFMPVKPPSPEIRFSKISTADVIASLLKVKKNKRAKASTLATYEKRLLLFQQKFDFLPVVSQVI